MKARNLKEKPFIIPTTKGDDILLVPGAAAVELTSGYDTKYVKQLEKLGYIELTKTTTKKAETKTESTDEE